MRIFPVVSAFLSLALLSGCGGIPEGAIVGNGVSLVPPVGWEVARSTGASLLQNTLFVATKPVSGSTVVPNLTVIAEALPQGKRIETSQYAQAALQALPSRVSGFVFTGSGDISINNETSVMVHFSAMLDSTPDLQFMQSFVAKNGTGYTITGVFPANDPESKKSLIEAISTFHTVP